MEESILRIGVVTSVRGRIVDISVDKSKNLPHLLYNGDLVRNVSVGSYVKINKGFEKIIGVIESEFITEDKSIDSQKQYIQEKQKIKRILQVKLVGFLDESGFCQGVKELPLIDNKCYILTKKEYDSVHSFTKPGEDKINIGVLASETSKHIEIGVNSLFASHIGIFGNTGSGKSYSLASLYNSLFKKYGNNGGFKGNTKFLLIDFNGEYSGENSIIGAKKVFKLSTRKESSKIKNEEKIPLNESSIIDLEIVSILAEATEKTQKPFIKRAIELYKNVFHKADSKNYFIVIIKNKFKAILQSKNKERAFELLDFFNNVLSNRVPDFKRDLFSVIEWHDQKGNFKMKDNSNYNFERVEDIENLDSFKKINDYDFPLNKLDALIDFLYIQIIDDLLVNRARNEHISPAINKLRSKTKDLYKVINFNPIADLFQDANLVVVDLNDVNVDIKKTIPLLIAFKTYEHQKLLFRENKSSYLNLIIDEAHNILSYSSIRESESWKDYRLEVFEEIIKEGRKFGTFLTIASQRPSDISSTIISQLHNYFLHRLINNKDIEAVEKTVSYLDKISFESLPILPTGTCILAGLSAKLPVVVKMNPLQEVFQPNSQTIKLTDIWSENSQHNIEVSDDDDEF
ncbi:MAG: helicase HerA domain-containing protein [Sphingobacterium sp.]